MCVLGGKETLYSVTLLFHNTDHVSMKTMSSGLCRLIASMNVLAVFAVSLTPFCSTPLPLRGGILHKHIMASGNVFCMVLIALLQFIIIWDVLFLSREMSFVPSVSPLCEVLEPRGTLCWPYR